jgi:hypothetical protein
MNLGAIDMRDRAPIELVPFRAEETVDCCNDLAWKDLGHHGSSGKSAKYRRPTTAGTDRIQGSNWGGRSGTSGATRATHRTVGRHVARFILVGLYTGTRSAAICGAALMPTVGRGHVDLEAGVFYRLAIGRRQTKKRQPPVRLPPRLLAHMRLWAARGLSTKAVVEWNGKPVESVRKGFEAAVRAAGLGADVTPHILRHTCATWLMQAGVNLWDAAGFLGMTVQQLEQGYGHHHADYQQEAATALRGQNAARNSVNKTRGTTTNVTKIEGISK